MVDGLGLGFLWHPLSRAGRPLLGWVIRAQEEGRQAFLGVKEVRRDGEGIPRAGLSRGSVHQDLGNLWLTVQLSPMGAGGWGLQQSPG